MILRRGLAHYRLGKSLRPHLENIDFSPQILESCGGQCGRENGGKIGEKIKEQEMKKVDSSKNAILVSLRGSEATEAIHTQKADSSVRVDRHALQSKARDDRKTRKV